jgi:flagellar motor component MotA
MADSTERKFSPCRLIGLTGVMFIIIGCIAVGTGAPLFINLPSLAIVFGIAFFALLATFGIDFLKFIPESIRNFVSTNPQPNPRYAQIALFMSRYIVGAALIGMIIGLIQMLSNLSDPSDIGEGMATALIVPFYALIVSEIFCAFLYRIYSDGDNSPQTKPLPLKNIGVPAAVTALVLIAFMVMLLSFTNFNA